LIVAQRQSKTTTKKSLRTCQRKRIMTSLPAVNFKLCLPLPFSYGLSRDTGTTKQANYSIAIAKAADALRRIGVAVA
jgi:hypothetical protein